VTSPFAFFLAWLIDLAIMLAALRLKRFKPPIGSYPGG